MRLYCLYFIKYLEKNSIIIITVTMVIIFVIIDFIKCYKYFKDFFINLYSIDLNLNWVRMLNFNFYFINLNL